MRPFKFITNNDGELCIWVKGLAEFSWLKSSQLPASLAYHYSSYLPSHISPTHTAFQVNAGFDINPHLQPSKLD